MIMASYAEAFGYTPKQFLSLTLPQLAAFGRYATKQEEDRKKRKNSSGSSSSSGSTSSSISDIAQMFGTPETKSRLRKQAIEQAKKVKMEKVSE